MEGLSDLSLDLQRWSGFRNVKGHMYSDPGRNMSSKGTDVAEQKSLSGSKHISVFAGEVGGEERKGRRSSSNSAESASEILL